MGEVVGKEEKKEKVKEGVKNESTILLVIGLIVGMYLIKTEGIDWFKKFFLLFFFTQTVVTWLFIKLKGWLGGSG